MRALALLLALTCCDAVAHPPQPPRPVAIPVSGKWVQEWVRVPALFPWVVKYRRVWRWVPDSLKCPHCKGQQ